MDFRELLFLLRSCIHVSNREWLIIHLLPKPTHQVQAHFRFHIFYSISDPYIHFVDHDLLRSESFRQVLNALSSYAHVVSDRIG